MNNSSRTVLLIALIGLLPIWVFSQEPENAIKTGELLEIRFKPFVLLDITDRAVREQVEKVIFSDDDGILVPVNAGSYADFTVAFIPKTVGNISADQIAPNSINADHKGKMIVYTRNQKSGIQVLWIDQDGKSPLDAIRKLLKALAEDRKTSDKLPVLPSDPADLNVRVVKGIVKPVITHRESATYTTEARKNQIQGAVLLSVVFNADGRLSNFRVLHGLPFGLSASAIQAALKVRFQPATQEGKPVTVRGNLEFHFKLY